MYNENDLPEYKMKELMEHLNLIDGLVIGGSTLPKLKVQLMQYNPSKVDKKSRIVSILSSGQNNTGSSDIYGDINVTIVISGLQDRSDEVTAKMIAKHYERILSKYVFDESFCNGIFGVIPSGVNGPYYEDNGRAAFELTLRLLIN